jgi:hypothetical protein
LEAAAGARRPEEGGAAIDIGRSVRWEETCRAEGLRMGHAET